MKKQRQSGKPHASVNFKANARRIPAAIKALKSHRLPVAAVCALNVTCFCNSFALFRCSNSSSSTSSSSPQLGFPIAKHNKKANEILSISVQSSSWPWMPRCPWAAPWVLMHFACNQIVLYFCFSSLLCCNSTTSFRCFAYRLCKGNPNWMHFLLQIGAENWTRLDSELPPSIRFWCEAH